jgi:hypothetical protein
VRAVRLEEWGLDVWDKRETAVWAAAPRKTKGRDGVVCMVHYHEQLAVESLLEVPLHHPPIVAHAHQPLTLVLTLHPAQLGQFHNNHRQGEADHIITCKHKVSRLGQTSGKWGGVHATSFLPIEYKRY